MNRQAKSQHRKDEYDRFENALKNVLSVSHSEMQIKLKSKSKRKISKASSAHVSNVPR
jgi:hypothetical protein